MARFVGGIESVGTPDDYTVEVKTSEPTLVAPWLTSVYILPKHYWESEGAVGAQAIEFANDPPIGSGPFKFVSWNPGEKIEFEAFDDFMPGRRRIYHHGLLADFGPWISAPLDRCGDWILYSVTANVLLRILLMPPMISCRLYSYRPCRLRFQSRNRDY